jgi:hypothetical protein
MARKVAAKYTPAWFVDKIGGRIQRAGELLLAEHAVRSFPRVREKGPHSLPWPLVVSLTSFPPRYPTLHKTLRALLDQTVQADHIVLWIAKGDMEALPENVLALQAHGLTIRTCDDLRSFKKIIPALLEFPEAAIVIADDDVYYAPDWLETLVGATDPTSKTVVGRYTLVAQIAEDGTALPYSQWSEETRREARSGPAGILFPVGIGGVLYPPGSLDKEVTNQAGFTSLCPYADDVWLFWMALRAGASHRHAGGRFPLTIWPSSQKVALKHENVANNRNDSQIQAMERRFGTLANSVPRVA